MILSEIEEGPPGKRYRAEDPRGAPLVLHRARLKRLVPMTIVLRVLSVFIALQVAQTIGGRLAGEVRIPRYLRCQWTRKADAGRMGDSLRNRAVAAVQLWRLRESGRRAAMVCTAVGVLYYVVGSAMFRTPEASAAGLAVGVVASAVPLMILVSPWAKQACTAPSAAPSTPLT